VTGVPGARAGVAACLVVAAACAQKAPGPSETLAAFGAAVERKDFPAAYALTSAEYRARVPLAAFRSQLEAGGADTQAAGRNLREEAARGKLRVEVDLDLDPGERLVLVEEGGAWRVDRHALEPWSQATPRAALRSFVRALEQRRYDVVLRLCPNRQRASLSVDTLRAAWEGAERDGNARLLAQLRAAIRAPIVEAGDEARMPYGERAEVLFVKEDGRWKIEDPD
jgi:hypothetical protein